MSELLTNKGSQLAKAFLSELKSSTSARGNTPTKSPKPVKEDDGKMRQSRYVCWDVTRAIHYLASA